MHLVPLLLAAGMLLLGAVITWGQATNAHMFTWRERVGVPAAVVLVAVIIVWGW